MQAFLFFFFFPCVHAKRGYGPNHSLKRLWKLGIKIAVWLAPCMFCEESFSRKGWSMNSVAWKNWLLWKKGILYLSGRKKKKRKKNLKEQNFDGEANCSGVVSCHRILMSLVMSMWFIFRNDWNDVPCSSCFCSMAMMLFLLNRGPWFSWNYIRVLNQFRHCQIWYKK